MSEFVTILQDLFEMILVAIGGFIAYAIIDTFMGGRTFKQTAESIEKSVALGVNTVVGLKVLDTAINAVKSKELTIDEIKEILEIVRSS